MDKNFSRALGEISANLRYVPDMVICLIAYLFHVFFHKKAIVHDDSWVTCRRLGSNELISHPNIQDFDDKFSFVLIKFPKVITHPFHGRITQHGVSCSYPFYEMEVRFFFSEVSILIKS